MIVINDRISYIEATENPLSADIGIIRCDDSVWLYDVGNDEKNLPALNDEYNVVISHFHADHMGSLAKIRTKNLYVSHETEKHAGYGTVITEDTYIGDMHIFPIPSIHAKGCLGLEVDGRYAFVGDALYCKVRDNHFIYNVSLLNEQILVLSGLRAPYFMVSHHEGMIREKQEVIAELKSIYAMREKGNPEIRIPMSSL